MKIVSYGSWFTVSPSPNNEASLVVFCNPWLNYEKKERTNTF